MKPIRWRAPGALGAIAGGALALLLVATGTVLAVLPASAAAGGEIVGVGSGKCLDVAGAATTAGTRANIFTCHGRANQIWTLTAAMELKVYDTATCLDVEGQSSSPGARVQIWPCNGGANQKWRIDANGTIVGVQSALCLDVKGGSTSDSAPVQMYTCHNGSNQRWQLTSGGADTTPPSAPARPSVSSLACDSATFSWDAATDNVAVTSYDVYHDGQLIKSVSGTTLSTTVSVVAGATWGLYVNARDAAGNVSQASATVTVTPPFCQADTVPPTAPTALAAAVSGTTVNLSWTAATDNVGVRSYSVLRNNTQVGQVVASGASPPVTTFADSGLAANTTYTYWVLARDAQGNVSPESNRVTATTGTSCGSPLCATTQVTTDTDIPWGLVTLPDGTILYSRRDAHDIIALNPSTGVKSTVGVVPNVESTDGEGGLLGLAIAPSFGTDHYLYIMHTSPSDNRIVRITMTNGHLDLSTEKILVTGILRNKFHDGGRLRFGPDGKLYAATGDSQNGALAQDKNSLNGKVLRLNPDGGVPSDNPFGNYVWSYGHRNPQGLAFDSQGRLWEQEFGNAVMDETNLIQKGGNYGWPDCEGTSGSCGQAGFIAPKRTYPTAEGSCSGIAVVRDVLYVACARGTRLYREVISGSGLTNVQQYLVGTYGRLRTVEPAPDGGLWLTTTNQGDKDSVANNSNEKILHVTLG